MSGCALTPDGYQIPDDATRAFASGDEQYSLKRRPRQARSIPARIQNARIFNPLARAPGLPDCLEFDSAGKSMHLQRIFPEGNFIKGPACAQDAFAGRLSSQAGNTQVATKGKE